MSTAPIPRYVNSRRVVTGVTADHMLPTTLAAGGKRSEVSYLLYLMHAFSANVVLERGSISVAIA